MNFENLPTVVQNLIRDAADLAASKQPIHSLHARDDYKALSDEHKKEVNHSYYDAVKYFKEWEEAENDQPIRNMDLLI